MGKTQPPGPQDLGQAWLQSHLSEHGGALTTGTRSGKPASVMRPLSAALATALVLGACTAPLALAAAPKTLACCDPPGYVSSPRKSSKRSVTLALVLPRNASAMVSDMCRACASFWHAGAAATSVLAGSGTRPRLLVQGARTPQTNTALGRQAAFAAVWTETVSLAVTLATSQVEDPYSLGAKAPMLMCRPGKTFRPADAPFGGWRVAHTQQPSAAATIAMAGSGCGLSPSWQSLGEPTGAVADWLARGPGGGHGAPAWRASGKGGMPDRAARLALLPLTQAAAAGALGYADVAAAMLSAKPSAPLRLAVASALPPASNTTAATGALEGPSPGWEAVTGEEAPYQLRLAARAVLRAAGLADASPPPPPRPATDDGAAPASPPRLLAVLQNPFSHAGATDGGAGAAVSDGVVGLPPQLVWWATQDMTALQATAEKAIASARRAAQQAGQADEDPSAAGGASTGPADGEEEEEEPAGGGAPAIAFSPALLTLASIIHAAPDSSMASREAIYAARTRAARVIAPLGADVGAVPAGASWATDDKVAAVAAAVPAAAPLVSSSWESGVIDGRSSIGAQSPDGESATPGRPESGTRGSLGMWVVLLCDRLSGPCRAASARWNALAGIVGGGDGTGALAAAEVTADGDAAEAPTAGADPQWAALSPRARAAAAYVRLWGVSMAAVDTSEPRAHPILRLFAVRSAPRLLVLSSTAEPGKREALAAGLVRRWEGAEEEAMATARAAGVLRVAGSYREAGLGTEEVLLWLARLVRDQAVSLSLEPDADTHIRSPEEVLKQQQKAIEHHEAMMAGIMPGQEEE